LIEGASRRAASSGNVTDTSTRFYPEIADFKESLREDLIDLLRDRRPQYEGPAAITLHEAQSDASSYST